MKVQSIQTEELTQPAPKPIRRNLIWQTFGDLLFLGFSHQDSNRLNHWFCECVCGEVKSFRGTYLSSGNTTGCGHLKEVLSYQGVHTRLKSQRGLASEYECYDTSGDTPTHMAYQWAYLGGSPDEQTALVNGYPVEYSSLVEFYVPLCRHHHRLQDVAKKRQGELAWSKDYR